MRPGKLHRGTCRPRSGSGSGHARRQVFPRGLRNVSREANPRAPHQAGRRIVSSLPVGTHKKVLRRPVSGIFRQNVASSYSPYATRALNARRWPLCVICRRGHPYVSRGPGPVDFRRPRDHDGALGPCTRSSVTASLPTSDSSRARIVDDISRSWVAHAVDSARTIRTPSLNVTGVQCAATSVPTIAGHRPMTEPMATSMFHPRSSRSRSSWSPSNDGSRPSRPEPAEPVPG